MKHGLMHILGCAIPIALLFLLPALGVSSECHSDKRKFEAKQGVKSLAQRAEIEHLVFAS